MAAIPLRQDIFYPESNGEPMGETELHIDEIYGLIWGLRRFYRDIPDVHVGGNLLLYYVQGDPRSVVCPDVFVAKGVSKERRRIYKVWEEGGVPCLVIEVTSASTRGEDLKRKKDLYERLGVEEYFLHDPFSEYLQPPLQGFRLEQERYRPIDPAPDGSLESRVTGLTLQREGQHLKLIETASGEPVPTLREATLEMEKAEERARRAEEELARLKRERE